MQFISKLKRFYKRNERVLIPGVLIVGVAADFITFRVISIRSAFIVLAVYWLIAGITIVFIQHHKTEGIDESNVILRYYKVLAPLIIQFTFGATLSASFIFYWFSGALSISWPFMLLIAFLMIANEAFREYYMKPVVQISVYYFITFSMLTLMLPYLFNSISAWIFVLSGLLSLVIAFLYLRILTSKFDQIKYRQPVIQTTVLTIFLLMNLLYFTNFIPPIPLSLTEAGVYHNIIRSKGTYILETERQNFFQRLMPGETIHLTDGGSAYIYSSIFAPLDLNTTVIHEWQYFDSSKKRWITSDRLSFNIYGGREGGYRGYSKKSTLSEGLWRVNIQTQRGQIIGRLKFRINYANEEIETIELSK